MDKLLRDIDAYLEKCDRTTAREFTGYRHKYARLLSHAAQRIRSMERALDAVPFMRRALRDERVRVSELEEKLENAQTALRLRKEQQLMAAYGMGPRGEYGLLRRAIEQQTEKLAAAFKEAVREQTEELCEEDEPEPRLHVLGDYWLDNRDDHDQLRPFTAADIERCRQMLDEEAE